MTLLAPFPYFGGKSRIAAEIWARLGDTPNYIEPFFGSGAVLLARPDEHDWAHRTETVNDKDGYVANFWRAVQAAPDEVAHWADWPVSENDLHARHYWLLERKESIVAKLEGSPDWYDAKVAGWWVWGMCAWIGSGWCSGQGPWRVIDGELVHAPAKGNGVNRKRPHLGDAGRGINRQLPHLGDAGRGPCDEWSEHLRSIMGALSDRLRRVRVCSGDWTRVCGTTPTIKNGLTGVFLDPPYSDGARRKDLYVEDSMIAAHAVREWAIARGDNPMYRIALCGYDTEHVMPDGWRVWRWKAHGGYGSQGNGSGRANAKRECVWFSPYCLEAQTEQDVASTTLWPAMALEAAE